MNDEAKKFADYLPEPIRSKLNLSNSYTEPGLMVWESIDRAGYGQCLPIGGTGIVLGHIFHRGKSTTTIKTQSVFLERDAAECVASRGQHLIDCFWGNYIAFIIDQKSGVIHVIRDPTGAIPCLVIEYNGVTLVFSDMEDIRQLTSLSFSVNYDFLRIEAMLPVGRKTITGLKGVQEVLPGQRRTFGAVLAEGDNLWDPFVIALTAPHLELEEATNSLYSSIELSVSSLAGRYGTILHNLGGLDSSVVLGSLSRCKQREDIHCVNFFSDSPQGDERYYAREVAAFIGIALSESNLCHDRIGDLVNIVDRHHQARPPSIFDCVPSAGDLESLIEKIGPDALFYGVGGDNVFFQLQDILSALDYVSCGASWAGLPKAVLDAARYGKKSLFSTTAAVLSELVSPEECFNYVYNIVKPVYKMPFFGQSVVGPGVNKDSLHPMLIPPDRFPKGKYFQILTTALAGVDYYSNVIQLERVFPLLSQPVIETVLRIPTWLLTYQGIDRGLARRAFRTSLPSAALGRMSKSSPDEFYDNLFEKHRILIKEILLNGVLVANDILDYRSIETALGSDGCGIIPFVALDFFNWEVWAASWSR